MGMGSKGNPREYKVGSRGGVVQSGGSEDRYLADGANGVGAERVDFGGGDGLGGGEDGSGEGIGRVNRVGGQE